MNMDKRNLQNMTTLRCQEPPSAITLRRIANAGTQRGSTPWLLFAFGSLGRSHEKRQPAADKRRTEEAFSLQKSLLISLTVLGRSALELGVAIAPEPLAPWTPPLSLALPHGSTLILENLFTKRLRKPATQFLLCVPRVVA